MQSVVDAARHCIRQDGRVTTRGEHRAIRRAMFNPIQRPAKKPTRPRNMRKTEFVAMLSTEEGRIEIDNRVDLGNPMPRIVQGMKALQQQILFWEEMLKEVGTRGESRDVQRRSRELYRTAIEKAKKELDEEWKFANAWGLQGYMASVVIDLTRDSPEIDNRGLEEALFGSPNPAPSSSHHTRFQSPLYSPEPQPELPVEFPRVHADGSIQFHRVGTPHPSAGRFTDPHGRVFYEGDVVAGLGDGIQWTVGRYGDLHYVRNMD